MDQTTAKTMNSGSTQLVLQLANGTRKYPKLPIQWSIIQYWQNINILLKYRLIILYIYKQLPY